MAEALRGVDPRRLDTTPVPPPWLGEQIVDRARDESRRVRPGRGLLLGAAATVAAGIIGAAAGFAAGNGPEPPREPVALQSVDDRVDAAATVIPHTWGVEITLDADGFAPGVVYRVVVLDQNGGRVGAGEFIGTGEQRMRCNLNSSVLRAQAAGFDVLDPAGRGCRARLPVALPGMGTDDQARRAKTTRLSV